MKRYLIPLLLLALAGPVTAQRMIREINLQSNHTKVQPISVDPSGIVLHFKNGEKIQGLSIQPPHQIEINPLDGLLCSGVDRCQGQAPSMLQLTRVKPKRVKGRIPNSDGTSMLVIVTNSGNKYLFTATPVGRAKYQVYNIN